MRMDYRTEAPELIRDFLTYHRTIQGHSLKTIDEYYLDLRTFFRFMKIQKGRVPRTDDLETIPIQDVDLELARSVTLADVYAFMDYLDRDRSLSAPTRARKVATIRSFYKYLTSKAKLIEENPMRDLDAPRLKKALPRYLDLDQCVQLLESVDAVSYTHLLFYRSWCRRLSGCCRRFPLDRSLYRSKGRCDLRSQ